MAQDTDVLCQPIWAIAIVLIYPQVSAIEVEPRRSVLAPERRAGDGGASGPTRDLQRRNAEVDGLSSRRCEV
jgi:hypothetical protein